MANMTTNCDKFLYNRWGLINRHSPFLLQQTETDIVDVTEAGQPSIHYLITGVLWGTKCKDDVILVEVSVGNIKRVNEALRLYYVSSDAFGTYIARIDYDGGSVIKVYHHTNYIYEFESLATFMVQRSVEEFLRVVYQGFRKLTELVKETGMVYDPNAFGVNFGVIAINNVSSQPWFKTVHLAPRTALAMKQSFQRYFIHFMPYFKAAYLGMHMDLNIVTEAVAGIMAGSDLHADVVSALVSGMGNDDLQYLFRMGIEGKKSPGELQQGFMYLQCRCLHLLRNVMFGQDGTLFGNDVHSGGDNRSSPNRSSPNSNSPVSSNVASITDQTGTRSGSPQDSEDTAGGSNSVVVSSSQNISELTAMGESANTAQLSRTISDDDEQSAAGAMSESLSFGVNTNTAQSSTTIGDEQSAAESMSLSQASLHAEINKNAHDDETITGAVGGQDAHDSNHDVHNLCIENRESLAVEGNDQKKDSNTSESSSGVYSANTHEN